MMYDYFTLDSIAQIIRNHEILQCELQMVEEGLILQYKFFGFFNLRAVA